MSVIKGVFLSLVLLLSGCLPIPDIRRDLELPRVEYRLPIESVATAFLDVAGYPEPHTPAQFNRALYRRYYDSNERTDMVIVMMPGIFGGVTTLDTLARQFVASMPRTEVWVVDRRANLLEDRSATLETLRTGDPTVAYNYYIRDAGTPDGFNPIPPQDLPFMAHWGLEVHLRDLHEIIRRANNHANTVILSGYSFGASMVGFYAAFDFGDGRTGDSYLDGLLLIDGVIGRSGGYSRRGGLTLLGLIELIPDLEALLSGRSSPYFGIAFDPLRNARGEARALLAQFDPAGLYPGDEYSFPITNRAVFALVHDDEFAITTVFSAAFGKPVGARYGGYIVPVLIGGLEGIYSRSVIGVADGYDYVDWSENEEDFEFTDLSRFIRSYVAIDSNYNEWYFPVRLLLDVAELDVTLEDTPGFIPNREVTVPTLAVGAGRGLIQSLDGFSAYSNVRAGALFSSYIIPRYGHIDIIAAEYNPLVPLMGRWVGQIRRLRN